MKPNVTWKDLGDWYNMLAHAYMYINEGQPGNAKIGIDDVFEKIERFRNEQGNTESFRSLSEKYD